MQFSVVMPAYNAGQFLSQAIESVLHQTWRDFELIAIDDGSTDNTLAILEKYAEQDARVRMYTQQNRGVAETLRRGFELARNEWILRMDADDLMRPNRMERQLAFIEEHPELAVASSLVRHIDGRNRVIGKDAGRLLTHESVARLVAANELIGISSPAAALRKSAVLAVGGFRQQFWPAEDVDLWNRLVEKGFKVLVQPEYLLDYRIHGNSASISLARSARAKVRWLKDCMLHRRAGMPEPDWESFLATQRAAPLLIRLNRHRKDLAKILYKASVMHYAQREYPAMIVKLSAAVLLQPRLIIYQIISKSVIGRKGEDL